MSEQSRLAWKPKGPGPFVGIITNHALYSFQGSLEVSIIKGTTGSAAASGTYQVLAEKVTVRYLSPFYGVTPLAAQQGTDAWSYKDTQQSYGMWMVPPDIGVRVLVMFVDGDYQQGFWIGCVIDKNMNHMVPGIPSYNDPYPNSNTDQYGTGLLPVGEYNKTYYAQNNFTGPNDPNLIRPVHPFADVLMKQGLLQDAIRGVTTSGARREAPSMVFGISTPGPIAFGPSNPHISVQTGNTPSSGNKTVYTSRLGGSTFVMDDGDMDSFSGTITNELVRLRTRTGHQLLMHNSKDLIYIGNSQGTAWLEFTSNGKIDIYAADSVSIHTEADFNLKADRDFNIEAGRNFNVSAGGDTHFDLYQNFVVNGGADINIKNSGNTNISSGLDFNILGKTVTLGGTTKTNLYSGAGLFITATGEVGIKGAPTNIANPINLHQSPSSAAPKPTEATADGLRLFAIPGQEKAGYAPYGNTSIMQRVPTHEPWPQHEERDPALYTAAKTDSSIKPASTAPNGNAIPAAPSANRPFPRANGPGGDRGTEHLVPKPWTKDTPFLEKVKSVCAGLGFDPLDLIGCMHLETVATMDPSIRNPKSTATGLIQFLEATARGYGTTTAALSNMSRVQQMDYVDRYFRAAGWPNRRVPAPTIANIYLTIFYPAAKFYSGNQVIASPSVNPQYYYVNAGLADPALGAITPNSASAVAAQNRIYAAQTLANNGVGPDLNPK